MAVDLYLYDARMRLRGVAAWGVSKLIHDERDFMLTAELLNAYGVMSGEYLGFECDDGRYRLFRADKASVSVSAGYTTVTATEAAVAELANRVVDEVRFESVYADEAAEAALEGSGFKLGAMAKGRAGPINKYYAKRWKVLREIEAVCNVRVIPYYTMEDGRITGKYVDIEEKTYERTGRILQRETDATNIQIAYSGWAIARMYGAGKSIGTEDPPSCVTFADVEWSRENGDPMDKPAGLTYLEDPDLIAQGIGDEDVFEDKNITDPEELLRETMKALKRKSRPSVSGTATAFDIAYKPGYEHKRVRLYNILDIPTDDGKTVDGIIIDIQRNYIRRDLTQIILGEEGESTASIVSQVASLKSETQKLSSSSGAAASRYIENKHLIQLNANRIVMNAEEILANAERIRLNASNLEEYQAGTDAQLTEAFLTLYGDGTSANAGLVARVSDAEGEISSAALTLYGDGTSANAGLVAKVDDNEASILLHADELGTLAEIKADKVDLGKYATVTKLEAEIEDVKLSYADYVETAAVSTQSLDANYIETNSLSVDGHLGKWIESPNFVKSIALTAKDFTTFTDGEGNTRAIPNSWTITYSRDKINYFGYG
ncbi:MAG: phage tail protein [Clostridia bacterium]|nr:phage tail protein [Clostridia bacterium]